MNSHFAKQCISLVIALLSFSFITLLYAQDTNSFAVNYDKVTPKDIFADIEFKTQFRFLYDSKTKLTEDAVTLKKEKINIYGLLKEIEKHTRLTFKKTGANIAVSESASSQEKPGTISGKVVGEYGHPFYGVIIKIQPGDKQTHTDANGDFSIDLPPGNYVVNFTYYEGYEKKKLENVPVTSGKNTVLNTVIKTENVSLDNVVITAEYNKATSSTEGLLTQQKKAAQLSDGISAEQIAKTPDSDVGATLKRITGVTTVNNEYVVVRSMGDRWNQAAMDGVNLPSTSTFDNQFSFKIIPTALVESVVVSKTATPDMNANFSGGYVEIKTKDIPRENFISVSIGSAYNSRSTFKDRLTKQRGSFDYFGYDDGSRKYPRGMEVINPANLNIDDNLQRYLEQSRRFNQDNFTNNKTNTPIDGSYSFAIGRKYQLKNNNKWGFVGALSLKNSNEQTQIEHTERGDFQENTLFIASENENNTNLYHIFEQYAYKNHGVVYKNKAIVSAMFNSGLQFGKHRFTSRNTYIHIYNNSLTEMEEFWDAYATDASDIISGSELPQNKTTNYPEYQTFLQNKLEGRHKINEAIEANWFIARSQVDKDMKDATSFSLLRRASGDDILQVKQIRDASGNISRRYFDNTKENYNWGANARWRFKFETLDNSIKVGYFGSHKRATDKQESAFLNTVTGMPIETTLSFGELLNGTYYNEDGIGWTIGSFGGGERFEATMETQSFFLMSDNKLNKWLRLVWGFRTEGFNYTQISTQRTTEEGEASFSDEFELAELNEDRWDVMPSINLTISPTSKTNIRFGYNKSVLRPQFAERLQTSVYNAERNAIIIGNKFGIESSTSQNYDFKLEWFPTLGEIFSAGLYYKDIDNPIEAVNSIGNEGQNYIYTINSFNAKLWGIEFELNKNLSFLGDTEALRNLFISANATFNETTVKSVKNLNGEGVLEAYEADRPLYGQSPYAYNLGMDYTGERLGFSIRHNCNGDQYLLVGDDYEAEEISMPYHTTDVQLSYHFLEDNRLKLKLSLRNIFDTPYVIYNNHNTYSANRPGSGSDDNPRDRLMRVSGSTDTYDEGIDRILYKAYTGVKLGLSINYSF